MNEGDREKRAAGEAAVDRYVRDGTCIGLGTGTTAYWAIQRCGERVRAGAEIVAVATSLATERLCAEAGIPVVPLLSRPIDVAIDGADEIAPDWSMIKGGGGALFREKSVALAAARFIVIVGANKRVARLGAFPLPLEVVPFALPWVEREVTQRYPAIAVRRREREGAPYVTDNGNAILDCSFGAIADPRALDAELRAIHGVVTTGLFYDLAAAVLVAEGGAVRELAHPEPAATAAGL